MPLLRRLPLVLLLLLPAASFAQAPSADWKTIETAHFRIHFPAPYETWGRAVAGRLEPIRERVIAAIGYAPAQTIDVIVQNPVAEANGEALTQLNGPRLVLWAESPDPESELGNYADWLDLLITHEVAHEVHLLRPSRNPLRRLEQKLLPLGPINYAPHWVLEGFATVIEGRLTGAGRPYASYRRAVLRRWAQTGQLPSYGELQGDSDAFLAGTMPYLAGSAYLEWLEKRGGPESLRKLWARLTARQKRSFEDAFTGVFGDTPQHLYGLFTAELTAESVAAEKALLPKLREGEPWQETTWYTGAPSVSPDGAKLAIVLRAHEKPSRLVVFSTGSMTEEEAADKRRIEQIVARDPEDVAPVRVRPLDRTPVAEYAPPDGRNLWSQRWMPDGKSLLFVHREKDPDGDLHNDLFRWWPDDGRVERITHLADVREPDPFPDGNSAVAVRSRYGLTQFVRVDLGSGRVDELTPFSLLSVFHPRVSPDGKLVAMTANRGGAARLVIHDLARGTERLSAPSDGVVSAPAWSRDGRRIYTTIAGRGSVDVHAFAADTLAALPVTRGRGASLDPEPAPDGSLYFLALEPDGFRVRKLDKAEPLPSAPGGPESTRALNLAPSAEPSTLPARDYGIGRQELMALIGGSTSPSGQSLELGIRSGDVVGRLDVLAMASIGTGALRGGATVAALWKGWPVAISLQGFAAEERPSARPTALAAGRSLDGRRSGLELRGDWDRSFTLSRLTASAGFTGSQMQLRDAASLSRNLAFVRSGWSSFRVFGDLRIDPSLALSAERGTTEGVAWTHSRGAAQLAASTSSWGLSASWERGRVTGAHEPSDLIQLGGIRSSILPDSALANRVYEPALPAGILLGDRHEALRVELDLSELPTLFYTRHELGSSSQRDAIRLAGVRFDLRGSAIPLLRLPAYAINIGAARILDAPLRNRNQFWLGLAWRP
jgi:Tol biopolymer transport system component